jgi:hypothetical protein
MAKRNLNNCFMSYHHDNDQEWMEKFRRKRKGTVVSDWSLKEDISHLTEETIYKKVREKMYKTSLTIVLIGERTGHRKWVDWEIWASLRPYNHPYDTLKSFKPNGLLGIYLPVDSHSVPERFEHNVDSGYAVEMEWKDINKWLEPNIEKALGMRDYPELIDNSKEQLESDHWNFLGFRI